MKKNHFLLLFAMVCLAGTSSAQDVVQPCATDVMNRKRMEQFPQIAEFQKKLEEQTNYFYLHHTMPGNAAKRTTTVHADTDWYDIPLAVHVIHNHGGELLADAKIYNLVTEMNKFYALQSDTTAVVQEFKKYVGKAKIRFHLATRDPNGNPTNGITHRVSYTTYGEDERAKFDQWPPSNYVNIWFENIIGRAAGVPGAVVLAYATPPSSGAADPFSDGIICGYKYINDAGTTGGTIDHEMGHIMNLIHTFGTGNVHDNKSGSCTTDDGVDDTPPTEGNLSTCNLVDSVCATNYFKIYTNIHGGDSLVNYPDTANEQNIMNYASCTNMFSKGQVDRMRAALNSDIGGRNNLWDSTNLVYTGALAPHQDLKPYPSFAPLATSGSVNATNYMDMFKYFVFPNQTIKFANESWNDTITAVSWTFDHGAATPTSNALVSVNNSFSQGGWVNVSMTVTGNNSGDTTASFNNMVFVANPTPTSGVNFMQEFNSADLAEWPTFNYYDNGFKWQPNSAVGYYDNTSMQYIGYDDRNYPTLGPPNGDFDDFFTPQFDLTGYTDPNLYLNFFYSGASRSSLSTGVTDTLLIDYSTDGIGWTNIQAMGKRTLCNKGSISTPYIPTSLSDWAPMGIKLPSGARSQHTVFRFRYKPNVGASIGGYPYSSGNNFYLDRLYFGQWPASISDANQEKNGVALVPNPTQGDAYVVVKDANNLTAKVTVMDITGKTVYSTLQQLSGTEAHILIPHAAIQAAGMYMVQTVTGNQVSTQKLVVY